MRHTHGFFRNDTSLSVFQESRRQALQIAMSMRTCLYLTTWSTPWSIGFALCTCTRTATTRWVVYTTSNILVNVIILLSIIPSLWRMSTSFNVAIVTKSSLSWIVPVNCKMSKTLLTSVTLNLKRISPVLYLAMTASLTETRSLCLDQKLRLLNLVFVYYVNVRRMSHFIICVIRKLSTKLIL